MERPYGLSNDEYHAIRQLQEGLPAPLWHRPVWIGPISAGLVWIDRTSQRPKVLLTSNGLNYPRDVTAEPA